MSFKTPELVQDSTQVIGTGTATLTGAPNVGYRAFKDAFVSGDTTIYCIWNNAAVIPDWEIGTGTWTSGGTYGTLTRTVYKSSNSDALVNWLSNSVKNVVVGIPGWIVGTLLNPGLALGLVELTAAGPNQFSTTPISTVGRAVLNAASYASIVTSLGLVIGTNTQAYDADLAAIAALTHTTNNVIRSTGSAWTKGAVDSAEVTHAATAPITTTTVVAALNEVATLYARSYSKTAQTTAQNVTTSSITAFTDLGGLAIPGTGNSAKIYQIMGQVTLTNLGTASNSVAIKVHLGTGGNTADAVIASNYALLPNVTSASGDWWSFPIPPITFTPTSTSKITISMTSPDDANFDVVVGTGETFVVIQQISNV